MPPLSPEKSLQLQLTIEASYKQQLHQYLMKCSAIPLLIELFCFHSWSATLQQGVLL